MQDEGSLYTWGCEFSWGNKNREVAGKPARKPDHHSGCLGLGTTAGQMLPTRYHISITLQRMNNLRVFGEPN